jgi:hypothetical protein
MGERALRYQNVHSFDALLHNSAGWEFYGKPLHHYAQWT